ncbi:non-homologous end-joining DNA ligase [Aequorivita vladivostokensis]|uniref:non-homologous end-joining DNA ligase n=1 Tax=Aequorivita vladivostokensis TaxID=171194 RepID=UPI00069762BE|nr:non-homologous end-joining DNA ligase [Aequorivita vladivostokensis]|tara:strand:- start:6111 stop:6905 length:795 start_codon:yes stop_codon:yes gene_type:complete
MKIAGIEITNPDKLIFPDAGITKLEMVQYYEEISPKMLPFLKNRPLTLHRFPDGVDSDGFYQKKASDYFPDFVKTVTVETEDGSNTQVICNSKRSLVYLANQGTVGFHTWLSTKDYLHKPDKAIFDLDPPKDSFQQVKEAAKITGDFFRKKGLEPNLMTSGKNGFHVWYSVRRTKTFDQIRPELKELAQELEAEHPELFTTAVRKNQREGKIFIDYLRNAYGQTSVCPYSLRPTQTASIAKPLEWKDLKNIKSADAFKLRDFMG